MKNSLPSADGNSGERGNDYRHFPFPNIIYIEYHPKIIRLNYSSYVKICVV